MAPNATSSPVLSEEDLNNNNRESVKEILCDGYYYDVSDFVARHPGGSIINYYTHLGEDATLAIQQFHYRSRDKVGKMMKAFKRRPATDLKGIRINGFL